MHRRGRRGPPGVGPDPAPLRLWTAGRRGGPDDRPDDDHPPYGAVRLFPLSGTGPGRPLAADAGASAREVCRGRLPAPAHPGLAQRSAAGSPPEDHPGRSPAAGNL